MNSLKVILIDRNTGRSAILRRALQDAGHEVISRIETCQNLEENIEITHADVIIVNTGIPDDEIFANLDSINKAKPKPIVMFTQESNKNMTDSAMKSGVNAFIVDGLEENRVQPIIDIAIARFREFQALKDELDRTKTQLDERKVIERAKGLLMKKQKLSEEEAYSKLRRMAMDKNLRIGEVAKNLIEIIDLL